MTYRALNIDAEYRELCESVKAITTHETVRASWKSGRVPQDSPAVKMLRDIMVNTPFLDSYTPEIELARKTLANWDAVRFSTIEVSILEICLRVHMSVTGSDDTWTDGDGSLMGGFKYITEYVELLRYRAANWRTIPNGKAYNAEGFDSAVLELVRSTLAEYDASQAKG
jgi:hypothetical protein